MNTLFHENNTLFQSHGKTFKKPGVISGLRTAEPVNNAELGIIPGKFPWIRVFVPETRSPQTAHTTTQSAQTGWFSPVFK